MLTNQISEKYNCRIPLSNASKLSSTKSCFPWRVGKLVCAWLVSTLTSGSWQSWLPTSSKLHSESAGSCHCPPEVKSPAQSRVALKGTVTLHGHIISATVPMETSDQDRTWEDVSREVEPAAQPSAQTADKMGLRLPVNMLLSRWYIF